MPLRNTSRKEIILERAEQHFAEHGFQGASLSAIARESDVGNPGLLHHFPSKEALYLAVLEKQADDLMARVVKRVAPAGSAQERLVAFVALQVEWMQTRPAGFKVLTRELLDNPERIKVAQTRPLEAFLLGGLALLGEAQAAGLVRRDVPALGLLTMMLGTLTYAKIARPTFAKAFADRTLASDKRWMREVADDVLRVLAPAA